MGPAPARPRATARRAARSTLSTSLPSTSTTGTPNARSRRRRPPPVSASLRVLTAHRLSLHTNTTGSRHAAARLSASMSIPSLTAPSPKKDTATAPRPA